MEGMLTGVQDVFYSRPVVYDSSDAEDDGSADGRTERETAAAAAKAAASARATERADRKAERKRAKAEKRLAKAMKAAKEGRNGAIGSDDEDEVVNTAKGRTHRVGRRSKKDVEDEGEEEEIQMPTSAQRPRRGPTPPLSGDELSEDEKRDEKEDSPEELRPVKSAKNGTKSSSRSVPDGHAPSSSPTTTTKTKRKSGTTRSISDGAKPKASSAKTTPAARPEGSASVKASSSKPTPKKAATPRTQNGYASLTKEEKDKLKKPTDEELQDRFKAPGAMERYISSMWISVSELKRLEAAGIITIKRGPFTSAEIAAIKRHLEDLKITHRMDEDEMTNIVLARGRGKQKPEHEQFSRFWPDLASVVPGRPVRYVKAHVQRMYDPRGKKGTWTAEEDEELLNAYERHPNEWAKIAEIVDRSEQACRDRWRDELQYKETRTTGRWTEEEERMLVDAIRELNEALGEDPLSSEAPWDEVAAKLGRTRTRTQCRKKWQDQLRLVKLNSGDHQSFPYHLRQPLLDRISEVKATDESLIPWNQIGSLGGHTYPDRTLKRIWAYMKRSISVPSNLPLDLTIQALSERLRAKGSRPGSQVSTPAKIRPRMSSASARQPGRDRSQTGTAAPDEGDDAESDQASQGLDQQKKKKRRVWVDRTAVKPFTSRAEIDSDLDLESEDGDGAKADKDKEDSNSD